MQDDKIVNSIIQMIKKGELSYKIKSSIKSRGISESEVDKYIEKAKAKILEKNLERLPLQNKIIYYTSIALAIITFVIALVISINYSATGNGVFSSIVAAFLICLFFWISTLYHKSWEVSYIKEKGNVDFDFSNFGFLIVPMVILFFIFYKTYGSVQNNIIEKSMVQTIATITDGYSVGTKSSHYYESERVDHYTVTVTFYTNEGEKVTATKSTRYNDHNLFFLGQEIPIMYSTIDPKVIELLVNDKDIRRLTGSQERRLHIVDLITFLDEEGDKMKMLNQIRYGWEKSDENTYINSKMNLLISFSEGVIEYVDAGKLAQMPGASIYGNDLRALDFKKIDEGTKDVVNELYPKSAGYESDSHRVVIERVYEESIRAIRVTIFKK